MPSTWAERGPVAETDVGTVGNGLGGASFLYLAVFDVPSLAVSAAGAFRFPFLVSLSSTRSDPSTCIDASEGSEDCESAEVSSAVGTAGGGSDEVVAWLSV